MSLEVTTSQQDMQASDIAKGLIRIFPREEIKRVLSSPDFSGYCNDPVGFGEEILGERFTDDVKRLMESVRDNPITIGRSGNAVGKSHGAARIAIWFYKCFPDAQVYTAAAPPEDNLRRILWGEIGGILIKQSQLFKADTQNYLHVERNPQSFITGVTIPSSGSDYQREAKFSGKHAPNMLFIIDEGDAVPDEVYRGIESCMSGGHARLLVLFNPRQEMGAVYRMQRDGRANVVELSAFSHPNVVTGENIIPGAVDREITVRRINEWTVPLGDGEIPNGECFEVPSFLVGAVALNAKKKPYPPLVAGFRRIMEPAFSYVVLGEYPSQSTNQLINREWIYAARARWDAYVALHGVVPPIGTQPIMGQDVAEFGDDSNVACFRYGGWVAPMLKWNGVDTIVTGDKATELYKQKNALYCNVDATGVGAGVAPQMKRAECKAESIKVAESATEKTELGEFGILRDQLWWMCREWLRLDEGAMLPPSETLIEELAIPTYEVKNGKIKIMSKDVMKEILRRSPDEADALCLTFFKRSDKRPRVRNLRGDD